MSNLPEPYEERNSRERGYFNYHSESGKVLKVNIFTGVGFQKIDFSKLEFIAEKVFVFKTPGSLTGDVVLPDNLSAYLNRNLKSNADVYSCEICRYDLCKRGEVEEFIEEYFSEEKE